MGPAKVVFLAAILCVCGVTTEAFKPNSWIPKVFKEGKDSTLMELKERNLTLIMPREWNSTWIMPKEWNSTWIMPKERNLTFIQPRDTRVLGCGAHTLSAGQSVNVKSKNYPKKYPKNYQCIYNFVTDVDSTISIDCSTFKLGKCKQSFVKITGGSLNKKYCGTKKNGVTASSTTNRMKITFKTKGKKTKKGFSCKVTASARDVTTTPSSSSCKSCGTVNRATRIVGGVETEVNEYPWQVALVYGGTNSVFCGGSVYNDRYIVTAAHCGQAINDYGINAEVLLGAHDMDNLSGVQRISVSQIIMHPNYDSGTLNNDIAILKLSSAATLSDTVKPACLPDPSNDYDDVNGIVSGWGTTSEGGSQPSSLMEVEVPTMSNADCQDTYGSGITQNMICAGISAGGKDSCQGDSGGPFVVEVNGQWVLVGVVSWGYGCARPGYPGVYARVTQYMSWLASNTAAGGNNLCSTGASTTTTTTTTAPSSGCKCGHVNTLNRIVGGSSTTTHEYPWQVALTGSNSNSPYCGGSIISNQWILTAAHCAQGRSPSNNRVVIGEHVTTTNSETTVTVRKTISEFKVHPNYNSQTLDNDVALIKLKYPIVFNSDNKIAPVCLPPSGNLYNNVDATITGWGTLSAGGSQPATLQEVTVPTMSNAQCQQTSYGSGITSNMICAGLTAGGKDSCQGDSGGPMVTAGNTAKTFMIQIGVVSWGYGCAEPNLPGVYARVNNYLTWISTTTAGSSTCPSA